MSTYEFRAWHKTEQHWIDNFMELPLFTGLNMTLNHVSDIEVTQWTGLLDKNGKRIFEGDIVRSRFGIGWVERFPGEWRVQSFTGWLALPSGELEVIGNVHENNDMLK